MAVGVNVRPFRIGNLEESNAKTGRKINEFNEKNAIYKKSSFV